MSTQTIVGLVVALVIGGVGGYIFGAKAPASETPYDESAESMESKTTATADKETKGTKGTTEWKIENAMSAAPEDVSKDATVIDWPAAEGKDFAGLRKGTNEWTCVPDYPATPGNDPLCLDKMAMTWFGAYMSHKTPKIAQAGLGYMLQGGSDPSNTDPYATKPAAGEDWMHAPPHTMIFTTTPPDPKVYGTNPNAGGPWVMWANTPYAHLMMPVE